MKRIVLVLAVAAGLAVAGGSARADWGGVGGGGGGPAPGGQAMIPDAPKGKLPDRYGFAPFLRKGLKICHPCCAGYPGAGIPQLGPPQGTLVFPNHPFVRSPRDYFMYEPGK
jgi:hypothetical protein